MGDLNTSKYVNPKLLIFVVIVLLVSVVINFFAKRVIDAIFGRISTKIGEGRSLSHTKTIKRILKHIFRIIIYFIALLIILSKLGVDIAPLLTGAGLLGLAFSLGSQSLIKDYIAGFFIIIENQYNVGETIKVADKEGKVIHFSLRTTVLVDKDKNLVYIPNSQVTILTRYKD